VLDCVESGNDLGMNDSFSNHAVGLPAPALRPFISHYAGFRAQAVVPCTHAGLPSRYVDLIISFVVLRIPETESPEQGENALTVRRSSIFLGAGRQVPQNVTGKATSEAPP
jgi:hypothetical protein